MSISTGVIITSHTRTLVNWSSGFVRTLSTVIVGDTSGTFVRTIVTDISTFVLSRWTSTTWSRVNSGIWVTFNTVIFVFNTS